MFIFAFVKVLFDFVHDFLEFGQSGVGGSVDVDDAQVE